MSAFKESIKKNFANIFKQSIADDLFECVWPFCGVGT